MGGEGRRGRRGEQYLDRTIKRSAGEGVCVLGIEDNLHDVVGMALKGLNVLPTVVPVPELD